jgi:hypothetical protein
MTQVIDPSDERYFTRTSDAPYDRHTYNIIFSNGQIEHYPSWEQVQSRWFEVPKQFLFRIEVLDKRTKKGKGF